MKQGIDNPKYDAAREIVVALRAAGHQAYFAGGCVRDLLLGVEPKDFDVATSATPDVVMRMFAKTYSVGAHFGVVLVCTPDGEGGEIATEVATFRHDGANSDGRRPDAVRFSTDAREDVLRRDFTINGMLLDPVAFEKTGDAGAATLDYVNGREDLAKGIVRAIGDPALRFAEDKLRMLRAVRFASRLEFAIEPRTMAAIRAVAPEIGQVSCERIRDELTLMLTEGHARRAFELLDTTGLLAQVLSEVVKMHGVEQPPQFHPEGDVWVHTMLLLEKLKPGVSATLAWGALLHDIGKPATFQPPDPKKPGDRIRFNGHVEVGVRIAEEILRRLRFSNEDTEQIVALVKNHMRFGDTLQMRESTLKRFLRLPKFDEHLALHWMDASSAHGDLRLYEFAKERFEATPVEIMRPQLLVTGNDLIGAGYHPGPEFKAMLEAAEDAQLEGRAATTEDGLAVVRERFGAPSS
jgi:poly(A) polymerase